MFSVEELSPFSESVRRIADEWHENAIITERNAYTLLSHTESGSAQWAQDSDGNIVVVKRQLGNAGVAREKIISDLARLVGLPVPPVRIWIKPGTLSGSKEYYSVSLKPFPNSKNRPPETLYKNDPFFPTLGIFDSWIDNPDRNWGNIIYEIPNRTIKTFLSRFIPGIKLSLQPKAAYIDHALALVPIYFSPDRLKNTSNWGNQESKFCWQNSTRGIKQLKNPDSLTRTIFERIVTMPDEVIAGVVNAVPDAIYSREEKDQTIKILCENRDAMKSAFPLVDLLTPQQQTRTMTGARKIILD